MRGDTIGVIVPFLDVFSVALKLLDFLLEIGFVLFFLSSTVRVVHLRERSGLSVQRDVPTSSCVAKRTSFHPTPSQTDIPLKAVEQTFTQPDTPASRSQTKIFTFSHIWSKTSMPSCTFFRVLSISCCSFLFAPMVHRQAGPGSKDGNHSEKRERHRLQVVRKHRRNRFTGTPNTNSGNLPKPSSHQLARKVLVVFRAIDTGTDLHQSARFCLAFRTSLRCQAGPEVAQVLL